MPNQWDELHELQVQLHGPKCKKNGKSDFFEKIVRSANFFLSLTTLRYARPAMAEIRHGARLPYLRENTPTE